ncbi:A-kinase-interacting protein 1 [Microcaecilia unicolor]|uniref:A-kinase-interacting protein 1-like n=1 Tax=Microcaecilia unicolor TaxID=1415580 RepID=A0A6P7XY32_9AMPH|nr:A-kinase-interacting protein 1-like [Microcaecilia unicolor]
METNLTWMKHSLERTGKLGQEVLQRAKRHKVNWSTVNPSSNFRDRVTNQEEVTAKKMKADPEDPRLEASFATIMDFMVRTTEQCEKYYDNVPASNCNTNEVNHICQYHSRNSVERFIKSTADPSKDQKTFVVQEITPTCKRNTSKSFKFEGTCTVTECPESNVEYIPPDQSVDLPFTL